MIFRFAILIWSAAVLLLFQNCGKAPMRTSSSDAVPMKVEEGPKLDAKTFFIPSEESQGMDSETVLRNGLELDVATGRITYRGLEASRDGQYHPGDEFCLSDNERSELLLLLGEDSVCSGLNPLPEDGICPMALRLPYAIYGSSSQSLTEVGSAVCLKAPDVDFCGGQGERVSQILTQVRESLSTRRCSSH